MQMIVSFRFSFSLASTPSTCGRLVSYSLWILTWLFVLPPFWSSRGCRQHAVSSVLKRLCELTQTTTTWDTCTSRALLDWLWHKPFLLSSRRRFFDAVTSVSALFGKSVVLVCRVCVVLFGCLSMCLFLFLVCFVRVCSVCRLNPSVVDSFTCSCDPTPPPSFRLSGEWFVLCDQVLCYSYCSSVFVCLFLNLCCLCTLSYSLSHVLNNPRWGIHRDLLQPMGFSFLVVLAPVFFLWSVCVVIRLLCVRSVFLFLSFSLSSCLFYVVVCICVFYFSSSSFLLFFLRVFVIACYM